jgi:ABC-type nitrate/sulfonate/bicarbonate transport system ATPase subunit
MSMCSDAYPPKGQAKRLFVRHQPAVLLVTHDVDEAIRLADRILILRGGLFVVDLTLDASEAYQRGDPRFLDYRPLLLRELGVIETIARAGRATRWASPPERVPGQACA